jgi:hypothetical protein
MTADAIHMWPLLWSESVINGNLHRTVADETQQAPKEKVSYGIWIPSATREESMKRLMMASTGHAGHDQGFRNGMDPVSLNPAYGDDQEVGERWAR